jgi:hypothetical protein
MESVVRSGRTAGSSRASTWSEGPTSGLGCVRCSMSRSFHDRSVSPRRLLLSGVTRQHLGVREHETPKKQSVRTLGRTPSSAPSPVPACAKPWECSWLPGCAVRGSVLGQLRDVDVADLRLLYVRHPRATPCVVVPLTNSVNAREPRVQRRPRRRPTGVRPSRRPAGKVDAVLQSHGRTPASEGRTTRGSQVVAGHAGLPPVPAQPACQRRPRFASRV